MENSNTICYPLLNFVEIAAEREERKRRTEESQRSRADGRKKTPVVTQRRKRSRDNNRDAFVVQDNNEDLGFRKGKHIYFSKSI